MFSQVDDFGWIKTVHSPNWCILPEGERVGVVAVPAELAAKQDPPAGPDLGDEDEI